MFTQGYMQQKNKTLGLMNMRYSILKGVIYDQIYWEIPPSDQTFVYFL